MFYTIYKTTNLVNGKWYIGKHQTTNLNDGYQGSGKLLKRVMNKYGIHNFSTEILEVYDKEWKMNLAEKILVVSDSLSYNLCPGGQGGFGYINKNKLYVIPTKEQRSLGGKNVQKKYPNNWKIGYQFIKGRKTFGFLGKKHSEETKAKMRASYNPNSNPVGRVRGPYKQRSTSSTG